MIFADISNRPDEWQKFVDASPRGNFAQSVGQYHIHEKAQRNVKILAVLDENTNDILMGGIITWTHVKMGQAFLMDYGPVAINYNPDVLNFFVQGLLDYAKQRNGLFLKMTPDMYYQNFDNHGKALNEPNDDLIALYESAGLKHQPFKTGMTTDGVASWQYVKDLQDLTEDNVMKFYHTQVQKNVKKAHKYGVKVRSIQRDELPMFHQITEDTSNRRGFHNKSLTYYEHAYDIYKDDAYFLVAEVNLRDYLAKVEQELQTVQNKRDKLALKPDNEKKVLNLDNQLKSLVKRVATARKMLDDSVTDVAVISAAMFIITPQEVSYLFGGSYQEYADFYGPQLIQDYMIREGVRRQIPLYNFLGIAGKFDGSDGVFEFKTRFGGYAQLMLGSFEAPVRPMRYRVYRFLKKLIGRGED